MNNPYNLDRHVELLNLQKALELDIIDDKC